MSMSIESVMQELTPALKRGRPKNPEYVCECGEDDRDMFGACKTRCLACRRDDEAMRRLRIQQALNFQHAIGTLRVINSFPPYTAAE